MKYFKLLMISIFFFIFCNKNYNDPEACVVTILLFQKANEISLARFQSKKISAEQYEAEIQESNIAAGSLCIDLLKKRPTLDSLEGFEL